MIAEALCVGVLCLVSMPARYGWTDPGHRHQYSRARCATTPDGIVLRAVPSRGRTWMSCGLSSRDAGSWLPLEGTVRVTATLPAQDGVWPALWLRAKGGASIGEVDLVEVFRGGWSDATQSVHAPRYARTHLLARGVMLDRPTGRHTWWARTTDTARGVRITLGVDGRTTGSTLIRGRAATALRKAGKWDLAANIAVSCSRWTSCPDRRDGPATMIVHDVEWAAP